MWTAETEYLSAERKAVTGNCIIYGQGGEYIATVPAKVASLIVEAPAMVAALGAAISCLRGFSGADDFGPLDDEAITEGLAILSRIDGAGDTLPDAPVPTPTDGER